VPDALSRLKRIDDPDAPEPIREKPTARSSTRQEVIRAHVSDTHAVNGIVVMMSTEMRKRIIEGYKADKQWGPIYDMLSREKRLDEEARVTITGAPNGLRFHLKDDIIYAMGSEAPRIYIPPDLEKDVFQMAHDAAGYLGFHRTYARLHESVYIHQLVRKLRKYIEFCPDCIKNGVNRHKKYGRMVSIDTPTIPYHTVSIDFIVAILTQEHSYDSILTCTYKAIKKVILIPGKTTWRAVD
jgi:hypothetical protein